MRSELLDAQQAREVANGDGDGGPITEWRVHVVTAENDHLFQDGAESDE